MERPPRRRAAAGRGWRRAGPPAACTPRVSLHTGVQLKSSYLRINNYTKQLNLSDLPSKPIRAQTQETYSSRREVVIIIRYGNFGRLSRGETCFVSFYYLGSNAIRYITGYSGIQGIMVRPKDQLDLHNGVNLCYGY